MARSGTADKQPAKKDPNAPLQPAYGEFPPYRVGFTLRGLKPFLFNRFVDYPEEDVAGAKTVRPKHDPESLVWRNDEGHLACPTYFVIASIINAGRFFRSPIAAKGGATNTLRTAFNIDEESLATFSVGDWDSIDDRMGKNSDRNHTPRRIKRPKLEKGWRLTGEFEVITPELYGPAKVLEVLTTAGRICGIGDGRLIGFGRFAPDGFTIEEGLSW